MTSAKSNIVAGVDTGTECVKAVVMGPNSTLLGRAIVPTRGYFQDCAHEALSLALEEARLAPSDLGQVCATGFAAELTPFASMTATDVSCHALAAYHHKGYAVTVVDIGGRDPKVIEVLRDGQRGALRSSRRCAHGAGAFLLLAARQLDVHPSRLEELAAAAEAPAVISSYCSVFAGTEILEQLRRGASRETVALGCLQSIAERICEIGGFASPVVITGGVVEYFPGVVKALCRLASCSAEVLPEPILAGALGAALKAQGMAPEASASPSLRTLEH